MAKDDRESKGGLVVDVFGEDDQSRLRHQPEVAGGLNKFIDLHRGKSYADLKKALGVASDPVEKDAIRMYSIANFRKDPLEDTDADHSGADQSITSMTAGMLQKDQRYTVGNTVTLDVEFVGLGPKQGQHTFNPGDVFFVEGFNESVVQVKVPRYACPRLIRLADLDKIMVKQ